jgi:coenzyme F420-0:L-glutamate ligase / coenzyme F420-1:gamma-L-glutamate ligase
MPSDSPSGGADGAAAAAAAAAEAELPVSAEPERPVGMSIFPVTGVGEIKPGDDLAAILAAALTPGPSARPPVPGGLQDGDVLVVTQKVVSKAEGRLVELDVTDPDAKRRLVEQESVRILRRRGELLISETPHGFICANAGVDLSNVAAGTAALLPVDSDRSARAIREALEHRYGVSVGVVVSDTFGRPWRQGVTDVAIGIAGVAGVIDLRGTADAYGRILDVTEVCVADELAGAAELVMGKDRGVPAAVVRGVDPSWLRPSSVAAEIVRPPGEDLFR